MSRLHMHLEMQAEVIADVYGGDTFEEVIKQFRIYSNGDRGLGISEEDITIRLADLPIGAKISIEYPCCPECSLPREEVFKIVCGGSLEILGHESKCECGFDWDAWVQNEYS